MLPRSSRLDARAVQPPRAVTALTGNARPSLAGGAPYGRGMDNRAEVRDFLTSRRARLTPEQAGLPLYGTNRRVKGLRREEVALLAGVSTDYYTRLERGNLTGVSESVLEALAARSQLDESERTHLFDLARAANASGRQRRTTPSSICAPASSGSSTRIGARRTSATTASTCSASTRSVEPCCPTCTPTAPAGRTWPATCSSTPAPATSTWTGRRSPGTSSPPSASRPAATPTTAA